MQITKTVTDDSLQELLPHGTPEFPLKFYNDDFALYENHTTGWFWNRELEWGYVLSGHVICSVGQNSITLKPGDGIFFNSRVLHQLYSKSHTEHLSIIFSPELIAPISSAVYAESIFPAITFGPTHLVLRKSQPNHALLLQKLRTALDTAASPDASRLDIQLSVSCLWQQFICEYAATFTKETASSNMLVQARARLMLDFISSHYAKELTLQEIAEAASISKSEALRCFRLAVQSTPIQYLTNYRLLIAKRLLQSTDDTITQIAERVGFSSPNYFIRIFKKRFDLTPKAYRKENVPLTVQRRPV